VLVKVAEREALVTLERLVNIVGTQGLQTWTSPTIMIRRVAWVLVRFKRVLTDLVVLGLHPAWSVGTSSSMCSTRNRSS